MNRAAIGLGSWLLKGTENSRTVSLDTQGILLELESYARWKDEMRSQEALPRQQALHALVREVWQSELNQQEQMVLQALFLQGKSESQLARELGVHHSAVGRCKKRAQAKLKGGLRYVMRYRELLDQAMEQE